MTKSLILRLVTRYTIQEILHAPAVMQSTTLGADVHTLNAADLAQAHAMIELQQTALGK
ncbi:hypothetical protein LA52FAK_35780 [Desulforhopalus sp. 52FAK]